MAKHTGKHSAKRSKAAGVAAFLVLLFSGFLLSTNLRVNRSVVVSNDTAELVEQRVKKVNSLRSEIDALSTRVNDLCKTLDSQDADGSQDSESAGNGTMLPAVEGPGLVVTLDDSPLWENMVDANGSSANINDYVVHQQDIEAVVNALWAGGAESMQIMDQRVLFNSAVRCSGNVLLLQGKHDDAAPEDGQAYPGLTADTGDYRRLVGMKLNALGIDPDAAPKGARS